MKDLYTKNFKTLKKNLKIKESEKITHVDKLLGLIFTNDKPAKKPIDSKQFTGKS